MMLQKNEFQSFFEMVRKISLDCFHEVSNAFVIGFSLYRIAFL